LVHKIGLCNLNDVSYMRGEIEDVMNNIISKNKKDVLFFLH